MFQYIIGNWDFVDLTLSVRPPVFIPRPETEQLVGLVLEQLKESAIPRGDLKVVEIGCGSGAISLALVHSLPGLHITCLDQSRMACDLTLENATNLNLVTLNRGGLRFVHFQFIILDKSSTVGA